MDVMGDTAPMHAICFPGGLNDRTSEEHVDDVSLTLWSFSQILQHMPPRLLADAYKVFHDACSVTAFVPWPPPSCTHSKSPLLNEHDLFHNVQLKHGKEFIVVGEVNFITNQYKILRIIKGNGVQYVLEWEKMDISQGR
jgi:hypothetical protein